MQPRKSEQQNLSPNQLTNQLKAKIILAYKNWFEQWGQRMFQNRPELKNGFLSIKNVGPMGSQDEILAYYDIKRKKVRVTSLGFLSFEGPLQ